MRIVRILGLGLLGAMLVAAPVSAAQPVIDRQSVDDTFVDEFLTEACGVEVTAHITGHVTFRVFLDANGDPARELNNYGIAVTFESENGIVRAVDTGADRITHLPDGSLVLTIIGNARSINIPGQGRVHFNVGTTTLLITFDANGDASVELLSQHGQHDETETEAICSVLG